ncbi:MAG: sigma-70 family RNA polymerase sigma factor [Anaerostipes sp.]|jgi:RNA polymerase sporulation-specific sigma factor|nr:sigma-70 family RNA polymerase sigma factor [Anaerostipes sp.]MDD3744875.1 sigma-70 family RNA polymerase sigma factor [Anaerostipes sp.]
MTDQELLEAIRSGDESMIDVLMERYRGLVRIESRKFFLVGGDEEDLLQEGMIGLFKAVQNYDERKEASFQTFATLCVKRQLYTMVTASNRKKHGPLNNYISFFTEQGKYEELSETNSNPEELFLKKEQVQDYYTSIEKNLSKFEKQVVKHYLDGKNYEEIAKEMGKSKKSIDNAIQRIRKKLG